MAIARTGSHREATKHLAIARCYLRYHQDNGTVHFQDCDTKNQVADFLTKSLGRRPFKHLTDHAMGAKPKLDISLFSRNDWRWGFDKAHEHFSSGDEFDQARENQSVAASSNTKAFAARINRNQTEGENVFEDASNDVQGGMLKLNLVYCNTMQVPTHSRDVEECICSDIDDFLKYEQHCARVLEGVVSRDLKVEAKQYGKVIVLQSGLGRNA